MKTTQTHLLVLFVLGALLLTLSCSSGSSSSSDGSAAQQSLAETLEAEGLTSFHAALKRTGILKNLPRTTPTLFGPDDAAFERLPEGYLESLSNWELGQLLLYHIVSAGAVSSARVREREELEMASGDDAIVDVIGPSLYLNEGRIVKADVQASDGVLHVIDRVLLPPADMRTTLERHGLLALRDALDALDAGDGLQGDGAEALTLMGPTDAAFEGLSPGFLEGLSSSELFDLLSYHALDRRVVASEALTAELLPSLDGQNLLFGLGEEGPIVNGASLSLRNIPFSGGVLHVVDAVLLRPGTLRATVAGLDGFETLTSLLQAGDLDGILDDPEPGPLTVFAPTDGAFAALPPGFLDALLAEPGTPTLIQILQDHMAAGALTASDVAAAAGTGIRTLGGNSLGIGVSRDGISVEQARLVAANVLASNGILHVIDAALLLGDTELP